MQLWKYLTKQKTTLLFYGQFFVYFNINELMFTYFSLPKFVSLFFKNRNLYHEM